MRKNGLYTAPYLLILTATPSSIKLKVLQLPYFYPKG